MDNDEKWLQELYRAYQKDRDDIEYQYYQPILQQADRLIATDRAHQVNDTEVMDKGIEQVLRLADQMYFQEHCADEQQQKIVPLEWVGRLKTMGRRWIKNLFSSWYGPLGAVAMALLVMVSVQHMSPIEESQIAFQEQLDEATQELRTQSISGEIERLNSWQYGFATGQSESAKAFSSGVLSVDLASIDYDRLEAKELQQALLTQLSAQSKVDINEVVSGSNPDLTTLSKVLNPAFSSQNLLEEFLLGQWIEVAYLQAQSVNRILKSDNSIEGVMSNQVTALSRIESLLSILDSNDKDKKEVTQALGVLQGLGSHSIKEESVARLSQQLLKLRTIWMVQPL